MPRTELGPNHKIELYGGLSTLITNGLLDPELNLVHTDAPNEPSGVPVYINVAGGGKFVFYPDSLPANVFGIVANIDAVVRVLPDSSAGPSTATKVHLADLFVYGGEVLVPESIQLRIAGRFELNQQGMVLGASNGTGSPPELWIDGTGIWTAGSLRNLSRTVVSAGARLYLRPLLTSLWYSPLPMELAWGTLELLGDTVWDGSYGELVLGDGARVQVEGSFTVDGESLRNPRAEGRQSMDPVWRAVIRAEGESHLW